MHKKLHEFFVPGNLHIIEQSLYALFLVATLMLILRIDLT